MAALDSTTSVTFQGITIWDEGQRGRQGSGRSSHEWTIVCRWSDYPVLLFKLMGGAGLVNGIATFQAPYFHPRFPWLAVTDVGYEGLLGQNGLTVGSDGMVAYDYCRLHVEFSPLDYDGGTSTESGEERVDFSFVKVPVPDGMFHYGTGTNATTLLSVESPSIVVPMGSLQRTLLRRPTIPSVAILSLLAHVNSNAFLGATAGQLLYMGCSSQRRWTTTGAKNWDLTHALEYNAAGWQKHFVKTAGMQPASWVAIFDTNNNPPYPTGDFSTLGFTQ